MHGQAVLQAMHPARVLRHVAADGAGDLGRRVGRVVQAILPDGLRHGQIAHARLHPGETMARIDLKDAVKLRQTQQDAVLMRQGPAGQARARAARHHGDLMRVTIAQHRPRLLNILRQDHAARHPAIGR